ncbi:hypothetical protein PPGU19_091550 (plasmid) [Paraburkholderia sp. PGU19]|nr:hypothetical protein PPGU19_091550 [Paraburkholderia sp. PGU19]
MADIRLDHFIDVRGAPVDRKLYVVLTTDDVFATGSWTRTAATLQGFPGSGNWILNYVADPGSAMITRKEPGAAGSSAQSVGVSMERRLRGAQAKGCDPFSFTGNVRRPVS